MPDTFQSRLIKWHGNRCAAEAAAVLGIPVSTYRKYLSGKRTPNALAVAELDRRMSEQAEVGKDTFTEGGNYK